MIDPRAYPELPELMIVGPGELHPEDLAALGHQVVPHFGDVWTQFHTQVLEQLAALLGAEEMPYLIPGTGTTCLDAAIMNLFEPGQRVVVPNTGFFGHRLLEIARQQGLDAIEMPVEIGAPIDPAAVADAAAGAHGVLCTHVDTSTGVRHPIREIAEAAYQAGAVTMVDGIASIGGELASVDDWGIGVLVTGTQKGLETPPGLGIIAVGPRGRARMDARSTRPPSWYLDLKIWEDYRREWAAWHPHPVTMPTNLVLALGSALQRILADGIDAYVGRRAALAERSREGLQKAGLEPVPQPGTGANLVVAMYADDPPAIQKHLAGRGIMIAGGLAPLAGRSIRIGLLGRTANEQMVDKLLEAIGELP